MKTMFCKCKCDKEEVGKLRKEVDTLKGQIISLMDIFGLCGYPDGWIAKENNQWIIVDNFKSGDKGKLPVMSKDFNLLLDHLKVEIKPEETLPEKIVPRKIIKKEVGDM